MCALLDYATVICNLFDSTRVDCIGLSTLISELIHAFDRIREFFGILLIVTCDRICSARFASCFQVFIFKIAMLCEVGFIGSDGAA